ncbi:glycerate kinase-like [Aplysia californica]|uniref:Glycerate kinase-like n=1 Tax=Aplysia californica TaxID=6500 RepID=A0ABM0JEN4_APLCA|nr:glycerate kinase-like [Aplysia californica]
MGSHLVRGVISVPSGVVTALVEAGKEDMLLSSQSRIRVMEGAKDNLPDQAAQAAAQEIHTLANGLQDGDLLVVLISGGGSALLPAPIAPVTLDEVMDVTRRMARAGASIVQLNAVRKQLEALKGGGLAEAAQPARVISLILSDVIGDPLDFIASGPTVPDRTTPEECLDLFAQLSIQDSIPESVKTLLTSTKSETQDQARSVDWSRVHNVLVGTNKIACEKAKETSDELGYQSIILSTEQEGEAREVSQMFATLASYISHLLVDGLSSGNNREEEIQKLERSLLVYPSLSVDKLKEIRQLAVRAKEMQRGVCIISGGETTVMVKGNGRGGRNQEMAVSAALELQRFLPASAQTDLTVQKQDSSTSKTCDEISPPSIVFLAAGTDGQDGPTPVAGAVVSPRFCEQAQSSGVNVIEFLDRNDSYNLLTQVDEGANLVVPGLTGTNVMDIQVLLVKPGV